jgi:monoamine oxidase/SAM-dependent methyltransferase
VLEVAIVGGGPGGLMTAWMMQEKLEGLCHATLFEATDRLGGKIKSRTFDTAPALYEAGVAEIYDYAMIGHDPLRDLITRVCGLSTVPMDSDAVVLDGAFHNDLAAIRRDYGPRTAKAIEGFRALCSRMLTREQYYEGAGKDDNDHPWADWNQDEVLEEHVADPVARRYFKVMARSDIASEAHLTSGLNALKNMLMDVDGYIGVYSIVGGNERLVQELAARVKADIKLNHRATRVGRAEDGRYRVTTVANGVETTSHFDLVVICLPHNWLSTLVFEGEELDTAMRQHIAYFDRPAHYLRLSVLFRSPFWRRHMTGSWFMSEAFNGCCIYDEGSRHDAKGHGVLNWLISGSDCLAWVNADPKDLLEHALSSLPAVVREEARAELLEFRTHPYLASVNAIPGGVPVRGAKRNHVPEPEGHPGLLITGDYLFDSTLNGLLDSADFATDQLLARVMELRYARGEAQAMAATPPDPVALPSPSTRIDKTYFELYRGIGPYRDVWKRFSDPDHVADLLATVWSTRKGARVLVAGSASGQLVGALRERGYDAWGIENNPRIRAQTPDELARYNLSGSVTDLPFDDDSFDVVIESCLCHVSPRRVGKAIRELHRVTRRGLLFQSVTADLNSDVLDRYDLLRGVRSLSTWWEWSDRFFEIGFDLAVPDEALLEVVWQKTIAAGRGPGRWFEDSESLRYCFFTKDDTAAVTLADTGPRSAAAE